MLKVSSSNISEIGFENGILTIKFTNGHVYNYTGISQGLFNNFANSQSKGKFFHQFIRNKYVHTRVI